MSAKIVFVFCALTVLQSVFSQCTSRAAVDATGYASPYNWAGSGLGYNGLAAPATTYDTLGWSRGLACDGYSRSALDFTPTSGGGLQVTSASAIPPTGISVISENAYEGPLSVVGELPFVGTTDMDGVVPSSGAGAINHACGNGVTVMASDSAAFAPGFAGIAPAGIAPSTGYAGIAPASISSAAQLSQAGFGPAGRFGYRGCAGRGIVY